MAAELAQARLAQPGGAETRALVRGTSVLAAVAPLAASSLHAADGTWKVNASGNWSDPCPVFVPGLMRGLGNTPRASAARKLCRIRNPLLTETGVKIHTADTGIDEVEFGPLKPLPLPCAHLVASASAALDSAGCVGAWRSAGHRTVDPLDPWCRLTPWRDGQRETDAGAGLGAPVGRHPCSEEPRPATE